ncbi:MAG: aspartate aminotransferase family protein [Candidatus Bathyarchaeia archaeon]
MISAFGTEIKQAIATLVERNTSQSKLCYERINSRVPGGIHSNIRFTHPYPLWFSRAKGGRIWDVDGNEYVDCVINMSALILGHGDERVTRAVSEQINTGLTCGVETELSVKVAEQVAQMVPCAESVKFSNSGTEAVMKALMIARAYSGKQKILKLEGGYNGWQDSVAVSSKPNLKKAGPKTKPKTVPENVGLLKAAVDATLVMPFNDLEAAEKIIKKHRKKLAAVIVEPVMFNLGCVRPKDGYLQGLKELTARNDVLLIFDEIISGFRVAPGGAQEYYGVTPDLATFAKAIANGFPMSAVAGRSDVMEVTGPEGKAGWAGVYNGSQVSLAASHATLEVLADGEVHKRLNAECEQLEHKFADLALEAGIPAQLAGLGGQFQVYFTDKKVDDYRSACKSNPARFRIFQEEMLREGIYTLPIPLFHHGLVSAHTREDIEKLTSGMRAGLEKVRKG